MSLTGLKIHKLLPGTNCKECGSNTCLAFAMKLAAKKAELSQCPYASEEAKQVLGAAAEPPVKGIALGPEKTLKLGGETVLYRHEKTFAHQTALAINVNDTDSVTSIDAVLEAVKNYKMERVGEVLEIDMTSVTQKGPDSGAFIALAKRAWETAKKPLVLRSGDPGALIAAAREIKGSGSVLSAAAAESAEPLRKAAEENGHALAVTAPDLNRIVILAEDMKKAGFNNLLLQFQTDSRAEQFQVNSIARRAALKDGFQQLGYPSLYFMEPGGDILEDTACAVQEICKYGGICVLPYFDRAQMATLMTLRLNIYTDPQKPIQVEPGIYPIGDPGENSPVFVTTNFSLTYFIVSGEIENSGTSAWLVVPECEGMSVLTAWAAGKFSGASIAKFVRETGLENRVKTREIVIPGYVAQISGELEESLPGWRVIVGPQEASDIEGFVKARLA
jgi:acetyl-CoA decarbonylase/synthase complex subunit gamma